MVRKKRGKMKGGKYIIKKGNVYWPSKEMKKIAWIKDSKIYKEAEKNSRMSVIFCG